MTRRLSVIVATRDRGASLLQLLRDLNHQTLPTAHFEIVVVDDGSREPVGPTLDHLHLRVALRHIRTTGVGQAAARQAAAALAIGEVLLFVDDDMRVGETFLAAHLAAHDATPRAVVLGRIDPSAALAKMPLFERYHARQLARWREGVLSGARRPRGMELCTGNASVTRADFESAGGFNPTLMRSEDRELGLRLEKRGGTVVYADEARSVHNSDHDDPEVWLRRAYLYGRYDHKISVLHPDVPEAHPMRYWPLLAPVARPVVKVSLLAPTVGKWLSRMAWTMATWCDRGGATAVALNLTALTFALEYFRGLRDEVGPRPSAWRRFCQAVRADHDQLRRTREKYHGDSISSARLPLDLVHRVGFQMLTVYRVMRLFDEWRVPLVPQILSRLIRHVYGAEIHWRTQIAPGVSIVHGNGLVLSHGASIGTGCILFQNVTLGESLDAVTGVIGAPTLEANVHVGPGASLLGPIAVGTRTKVGAGAVLMQSVGDDSLVMPPTPTITSRSAAVRPALRPVRRQAVS